MTCDRKISLCSLFVICATCLYRLESPSRLTVHIVSRLSQQIEVIYSDLLLINVIDLYLAQNMPFSNNIYTTHKN
jgi:hypothetical protein